MLPQALHINATSVLGRTGFTILPASLATLPSLVRPGDGGFKDEGVLALPIHPGVVASGKGIKWQIGSRLMLGAAMLSLCTNRRALRRLGFCAVWERPSSKDRFEFVREELAEGHLMVFLEVFDDTGVGHAGCVGRVFKGTMQLFYV
eukprot:1152735-Pelagomonas_calceolata.AAC.3